MKKRTAGFVSLLVLTAEYFIIRYPLFKLHGMKEWPLCLFMAGAVVISVSGLVKTDRILPVCTALGYSAGFILGYLFQFDYGRGLNSMWIIWTFCFAAAAAAGFMAGMFVHSKRSSR